MAALTVLGIIRVARIHPISKVDASQMSAGIYDKYLSLARRSLQQEALYYKPCLGAVQHLDFWLLFVLNMAQLVTVRSVRSSRVAPYV